MTKTFLISDTHFGHVGMTKFLDKNGDKVRPWDNIYAMDEALISNWNSVVSENDKVYHLGDVVINRRALSTLARLNGRKVLIKGNHDIFRIDEYLQYFDDIRGSHVINNIILTHIPIHNSCIGRFRGNIHGHLHTEDVTYVDKYGNTKKDPSYLSVCVEKINYTPILLDEAIEQLELQYINA